MLPGKMYKPEDFLGILRRRIWWVLVPFAVVSAVTAVLARRLPDLYYSETNILVVPQQIPEAYVRSTVTARLEDRLQQIRPQILSRTRLEQIIEEFDLYARERAGGALMEDIVARMGRDIRVSTEPAASSFRIGYTGQDAVVVQKVVSELATLFINENLRDRSIQAEGTNQFIEASLADALRQLQDIEHKVAAYRLQHAGELPTQLDSNLQQVQNARVQSQSLSEALNQSQERRLALESQLANLKSPPSDGIPVMIPGTATPPVAGSTAQRLTLARNQQAMLEASRQPGHPDLATATRQVQELEAALQAELSNGDAATTEERTTSPAEIERRRQIVATQALLTELDKQMVKMRADQAKLDKQAEEYQARVDAVPTRETEYTQLTRDYELYKQNYTSLLGKRVDSKIAANLERRQIGEQFKLLDPARRAEKPVSPDRRQINMMGMFGGLALGVLLVGFLEYRDTSFKTDSEVTAVLGLPVVAVVPIMESDADHRGAVRRRLATGLGFGSIVVVCLTVVAYSFVR